MPAIILGFKVIVAIDMSGRPYFSLSSVDFQIYNQHFRSSKIVTCGKTYVCARVNVFLDLSIRKNVTRGGAGVSSLGS